MTCIICVWFQRKPARTCRRSTIGANVWNGLPTCYVGLVAVGVQEQAEDIGLYILVPPLLRNCLMLNYIFSIVIISPPEQWFFATVFTV